MCLPLSPTRVTDPFEVWVTVSTLVVAENGRGMCGAVLAWSLLLWVVTLLVARMNLLLTEQQALDRTMLFRVLAVTRTTLPVRLGSGWLKLKTRLWLGLNCSALSLGGDSRRLAWPVVRIVLVWLWLSALGSNFVSFRTAV